MARLMPMPCIAATASSSIGRSFDFGPISAALSKYRPPRSEQGMRENQTRLRSIIDCRWQASTRVQSGWK
eukprot:4217294-Alexandrium_andersonii.AAC.1